MRRSGLPPVIDDNTRVLVLGSFPSDISLAKSEYYANPRNQFWRLMERVLERSMTNLPYEARLDVLLSSRIGLWDSIAECERTTSSDSRILLPTRNPLDHLVAEHLLFNGKKAWEEGGKHGVLLPSSSPANTLGFEEKARLWKQAFTQAGIG